MTVSAFTNDDGYTETAYINEIDNVHPAVRIQFRPMPVVDRNQVADAIGLVNGKNRSREQDRLLAKALEKHLLNWEFLDSDGKVIDGAPAVSAESILCLKMNLYARILSIIYYGSEGGDPDPGDPKADGEPESTESKLAVDQKN